MDDKDTIIRKVRRAVTDCDGKVAFDENRPGISNLVSIYSAFTGLTPAEIEKKFEGVGYGEFKNETGEAVASVIVPINERKNELLKDKTYLEKVMAEGAEKANYRAKKMLDKVYRKVGLYQIKTK